MDVKDVVEAACSFFSLTMYYHSFTLPKRMKNDAAVSDRKKGINEKS
jgi:hypothetical protein